MDAVDTRAKEGHKVLSNTGTANNTAADAATFSPECTSFRLKNLSSTVKLLYSIDNGSTYLTLEPLSTIDRYYILRHVYVKTTSSTAAYNIEYTEAR